MNVDITQTFLGLSRVPPHVTPDVTSLRTSTWEASKYGRYGRQVEIKGVGAS